MVFVLANCYEIASYDTPQQAMKDASGTEVRDGTNNILIVGKNSKVSLTMCIRFLNSEKSSNYSVETTVEIFK